MTAVVTFANARIGVTVVATLTVEQQLAAFGARRDGIVATAGIFIAAISANCIANTGVNLANHTANAGVVYALIAG